jgi:hypothetical protein
MPRAKNHVGARKGVGTADTRSAPRQGGGKPAATHRIVIMDGVFVGGHRRRRRGPAS